VLPGFDRLVIRDTLRMLAHRAGMMVQPRAMQMLVKVFAGHAQAGTVQLQNASEDLARCNHRPIEFVASSAMSKRDFARKIAHADGIEPGLICLLTAVEPSCRMRACGTALPNACG